MSERKEYATLEEEFYDSIPNANTRRLYRVGLEKFAAWFKHTPSEILQMVQEDLKSDDQFKRRRFTRELERFHGDLKKAGIGTNSARNYTQGLRQFFRYYAISLQMRRGSAIGKTVLTERTYPLTIQDLRKMFGVADLKQRVILAMAKDLALRVGDFVEIKKADLPDLNSETPVPFDIMTSKEQVLAKAHLSAETVELLKTYLPTIAQNPNPYLFPSNGKGSIDADTVGWNLKKLAEKASITIPKGKRLSFHAFRKLFFSTGKNLNIDGDVLKAMCGKSVRADVLTYMNSVQWAEKFSLIADALKIQGFTAKNGSRLEDLEERNKKLADQVALMLQIIEAQQKRLEEIKPEEKGKMAEINKIIFRLRSTVLKPKEEETS
jgi:integrase